MTKPATDDRSAKRRALDEQIAGEPKLAPLDLPADVSPSPMEAHLANRKTVAVPGVVHDGVVHLLDPAVKLPEQSRVIIVASVP